jgi:zinc transport system permease protein
MPRNDIVIHPAKNVAGAVRLPGDKSISHRALLFGALAAALISALIIGLVSLYARQREDTVISAVWAVGMAIGLIFFAKTPGYVDPMSYLFGNILLISAGDVWLVLGMDVAVAAINAEQPTARMAIGIAVSIPWPSFNAM